MKAVGKQLGWLTYHCLCRLCSRQPKQLRVTTNAQAFMHVVTQLLTEYDRNHQSRKELKLNPRVGHYVRLDNVVDPDPPEVFLYHFAVLLYSLTQGRIKCEATHYTQSVVTFQLKPNDDCKTDKVTPGEKDEHLAHCAAHPNHAPF